MTWIIASIFSAKLTTAEPQKEPPAQKAVQIIKQGFSELIQPLSADFPGEPAVVMTAVEFYMMERSYNKAAMLLENAMQADPKNIDFNYSAGLVAFDSGLYEKAIGYWQKHLALNPNNARLHNRIAEAKLYSGKEAEAIEEIESNIESLDHLAKSWYLLGQGYLQTRNYKKAKDCYQRAIEIEPEHLNANHGLGKTYLRLKQPGKAKKYLEFYKQNRSKTPEGMTQTFMLDNSENDAREFSRLMTSLYKTAAGLYKKNKQPQKAIAALMGCERLHRDIISAAPNLPYSYKDLAFFYLATGMKADQAQALGKKAVSLEGSAVNYFVLAYAYYAGSNLDEADKAIEQAMRLEPDNAAYKQISDGIKKKRAKQ